MSDEVVDQKLGDEEHFERIQKSVAIIFEVLRKNFLKVKPVTGRLGFYIETGYRSNALREFGVVVDDAEGNLVSYSLNVDYIKDGFLDWQQLSNVKGLFAVFVEWMHNEVFFHDDPESHLNYVPLWFTSFWTSGGNVKDYATGFGYSFKKHDRFGNSPSGTRFTGEESNVHLWADYLNKNLF